MNETNTEHQGEIRGKNRKLSFGMDFCETCHLSLKDLKLLDESLGDLVADSYHE